ncbi:MAG: Holliday junction resolvase RuvX [Coriobacteriaceae bacterium]|nr:Holliday junction resolvase RuvX [Coriobacteriaceae bacterium]MDD6635666.1 Holliday junction resolvase RuvX [Coriobacteriaceae bacterium]MDD7431624.1 Holliday junction resolvase RuvX [Coriobacteriaceae bacterium]MDO4498019.1 Holliday junction resolvase RuvX [Coriobacteriaceae bacterium]MDY4987520.1 Holliday junction resolvase RuvX [Eggerthellaceae bacterium]
MRVMALDIGKVRCGIAISDPAGRIATPICVLPTSEVEQNAPSFRRLLEDWEPEMILSGLPYTLAGEEGPQAESIRAVAGAIAKRAGLPLEFTDERLSSSEAKRSLREKGFSEKEMRGKVDMIAASLFLQSWLDSRANSAPSR